MGIKTLSFRVALGKHATLNSLAFLVHSSYVAVYVQTYLKIQIWNPHRIISYPLVATYFNFHCAAQHNQTD